MPNFNPTAEQLAILDAVRNTPNSIMVDALAGSGKTSTLELIAEALNPPAGQMLMLAFNVKIKKELEARLPSTVTTLTMNSLGHRAWAKLLSGKPIRLEERKIGGLVTGLFREYNVEDPEGDMWKAVRSLVDAARNSGLVLRGQYPTQIRSFVEDEDYEWEAIADKYDVDFNSEILTWARAVLKRSVEMAYRGEIDYTDQIYMSACFGASFPRFGIICVDEAQDLSPLNHEMVRRTAAGRIIAVGDPNQSIYAFRGADMDSMGKLEFQHGMLRFPLSISFRCPRKVIANVQRIVPHIQHAPWAKEGEVKSLRYWDADTLPQTCMVLCRNNAPLMSLAFKLIKRRRAVNFIGSDIAKGLTALVKKIGPSLPIAEFVEKLSEWRRAEIESAMTKDKKELIARIHDKFDCIMAVVDGTDIQHSSQIEPEMDRLFSMSFGGVKLATGHKAKGLEEDHVFFLDPWRIPSKYARAAKEDGNYGPMQQEMNLKYVIETRAKQSLTYVNLDHFEADDEKGGEEQELPRFITSPPKAIEDGLPEEFGKDPWGEDK